MIYPVPAIAAVFPVSFLGAGAVFAEQRARGCDVVSVEMAAVGEGGSH